MSRYTETPGVAMQVSRDVVVASIQVDLDDDVLARFQDDLLGRVQETSSRAVILDVSGLETLDSHEFAALRRIIRAASIMGTESVLVGLQPGVVSALIEVGADVDGLKTAVDLDGAFALLDPEPEFDDAPDSDPDSESEAPVETIEEREGFPALEREPWLEDGR